MNHSSTALGQYHRYRSRVAGPRMGVSSRIRSGQGRFHSHPMSGFFRCSAIANRFRWHKLSSLETQAVFSPDGRWIAYTSNENGQPNVYVQPFLRAGGKYQVSRDGGSHPVWRADGKELFYLGPDGTHDGGADQRDRSIRCRSAADPLPHRRATRLNFNRSPQAKCTP